MGEGDLELLEDRPMLNCSHTSSFPQRPFQALSYSSLKALPYSSGLLLAPHALQIPPSSLFYFHSYASSQCILGTKLIKCHIRFHVGQAGLESHSKNITKQDSEGLCKSLL